MVRHEFHRDARAEFTGMDHRFEESAPASARRPHRVAGPDGHEDAGPPHQACAPVPTRAVEQNPPRGLSASLGSELSAARRCPCRARSAPASATPESSPPTSISTARRYQRQHHEVAFGEPRPHPSCNDASEPRRFSRAASEGSGPPPRSHRPSRKVARICAAHDAEGHDSHLLASPPSHLLSLWPRRGSRRGPVIGRSQSARPK